MAAHTLKPSTKTHFDYCIQHQRIKAQGEWIPFEGWKIDLIVACYTFASMKVPSFTAHVCDQCPAPQDTLMGVYFLT